MQHLRSYHRVNHLMRGRAPLYPGACWRRWASRRKWPDPQLLLRHQSPPLTLLPTPTHTQDGTHATRGNAHTRHTPQTHGKGLG